MRGRRFQPMLLGMRRHLTYANAISSICLLIVLGALVGAAPAAAEVTVTGTGEPAYTNSANNTQFVHVQVPSGTDGYRVHVVWYRNNVQVHELRAPAATGTMWIDWTGVPGVSIPLQEGTQYGICVRGEFRLPNDSLWFPDGQNSCAHGTQVGKRAYTTIDRTKPTTSVTAAGGAEFTKNGAIPLSIGFQDGVAGPFPFNYVCVKAGADPCESGFNYSAGCSVPGGPGKNTTFGCNVDASQLADGPVTVCAIAADASVPNNASSADQAGNAGQANHADAQCDTVVLDRQAPALAVNASKTVVLAGEAVSLTPDASDSGSGLDAGTASWEFGDGTPAAAGGSVSHAFAQPGTYVVTYRAKDRAGNESAAQKTITVEAPPTGGGTTPPGGGTTTPGGGTAPGGTPAPGGNTPPPAGAGQASVRIGSVTVLVPKRVRLGRLKQLVLGARTDQAGRLTLKLTRGKKVLSKLSVGLSPGETKQRLRLPKRLKAGTYTVKIAFKPTGASWSATGTAKVAFQKKR